jgi:hypothetical protein
MFSVLAGGHGVMARINKMFECFTGHLVAQKKELEELEAEQDDIVNTYGLQLVESEDDGEPDFGAQFPYAVDEDGDGSEDGNANNDAHSPPPV